MQPGDFTTLAETYAASRPDYSREVLDRLLIHVDAGRPGFRVADVGAGTGIWSRMLAEAGLEVVAVEPNDAMREQGLHATTDTTIRWQKGSAEATGLPRASADWVTMASSFHWVRLPEALDEFVAVLRPGGHLTILWNPRDIAGHPLHERIEARVYGMIPDLTRFSSGSSKHAPDYAKVLASTGAFSEVVYFEGQHQISMSKERYLTAWRSVNDIQRQAGPERFQAILSAISEIIEPLDQVVVPYLTRAWTAQRCAALLPGGNAPASRPKAGESSVLSTRGSVTP